jgi:pyruvate-ferredoxin/flavodoxin oxidoreductase
VRKEIGLIGMAHRTTYVMQGTIAHPSHMIEGFIRGLKARRPALFNLYSVLPAGARHRRRHERATGQAGGGVARLSALPLRPGRRQDAAECFDLEGNPSLDTTGRCTPSSTRTGRREKTMEVPLTFADFAVTEARFRKHFRKAPPDTWNENMVPLAEFLELVAEAREGKFPYIWSVDKRAAPDAAPGVVKAAEKCTAGCIHPGTPWNMNEPGVEKLMARAAKFN